MRTPSTGASCKLYPSQVPSGQGISEFQARVLRTALWPEIPSSGIMNRVGGGAEVEVGTGAVIDHQADRRLTLPEGEEDDGLDHEELEDGAIGTEQLPCGEVEEEESVKSQADGDVVDDGHVEVPTGDTVGQACCGWDQP